MRLFLITVVLILLGLAGAGLFLQQFPERGLRAIEWAVDTLTPLDLELRGARFDSDGARFRADEIHLHQDDSEGNALLSITGFASRDPLLDLLVHRLRDGHLSADSVIIHVAAGDDTADPAPAQWMRYLRWLPETVEIDQLHVVVSGESTRVSRFKDIVGQRQGPGRYRLRATSDYEDEPLDVTLYLYAIRSAEGFRGLQLRGEFHATRSSRVAIAEGELRGGIEEFSYDFTINAAFPEVRALLVYFEKTPQVEGNLQVRGRLRGDLETFTLSDAEFRLANLPDYEFTATGDFSYRGPGRAEINAQADGHMDDLGYLLDWVDLDLTALGRARARLKLTGPLGQVAVERFELSTRHTDGLQVDIAGSLAPGAISGQPATRDNRVDVTMRGPGLAVLRQWLGEPPFEPGIWELNAEVTGTRDGLRASRVDARLGEPGATEIRATGSIDRLSLARPITAASLSGIDLQLTASAPSLNQLNSWLDLSLPPDHRLGARLALSGEGNSLHIGDGSARLEGSDLEMDLDKLSGRIKGGEQWRLESVRGDLKLSLSDTSALSQYLDLEVPVLGALSASATLAQEGRRFHLADLAAAIDSEHVALSARGRMDDLAKLDGTTLDIQFSGLDTRNLVHTLREGFSYPEPLGSLSGGGRLQQDGSTWNLSRINISNTAGKGLSLALSGDLRDLTGLPRGDLSLDTRISNRPLLAALTGLPLPDLRAALRTEAGQGRMRIRGDATLGETQWRIDSDIGYGDSALTDLRLTLASPHVRIADLGLGAGVVGDRDRGDTPARDNSLESLIEALPNYPLELGLHLGGVSGESTRVRSLDLEIEGRDRQYLLKTLNIDYEKAVAEIRGLIDLKTQPPAISLGGQALAIDMSQLVRDLGVKSDVQGVLNLRGGVSARGVNRQQWLGSLDGSVAIALEDAEIEGAAYDVLATDLLAWIYSGAALEKSTHVQCTMAHFALKSGVATTDSIFIESPRMVATGEGELDFVRGKMDITLVPRSKNRTLQIPSSVTLRGDMSKPKTRVSPIAATADASAEALMLIPNLTLKLFGIKKDNRAATRPCEASLGR
ncbi:AsmA-like C-terminal region-containing protein [Parahaliea mediterranea]|uniref:AsmA family protein n=1 Tax=Parahaliea mediterranea TaxID=651086 RepID=A0A939DHX3_9GAMM|nr:AsmA-like C-terminal region-containing protein [Parahaliea mediterranea]MBN7798430.1 AsmA family protein [Parahaliea mediterranea]